MRFIHTKCGGEIDIKKRQCTKCKKKWNPISFRLDPTGIRPMVDRKGRPVPGGEDVRELKKKYATDKVLKGASWVSKVPGAVKFARLLPKWPRWTRILTSSAVLAIVAVGIFLLLRGC